MPEQDQIIELLNGLFDGKQRALVAISQAGRVQGEVFDPHERDAVIAWCATRSGKENLYFHVNPVRDGTPKGKATKADIKEVTCLHVDVDDQDALPRILAHSPPPTAVVFSGGGYHAYWRLGTPTTVEMGEAYCGALAKKLGGDACHNSDRILRLPGTINLPNENKRAAGRTPVQAQLLREHTDWSRIYELSDFECSPALPQQASDLAAIQPRRLSLSDLPQSLPPATRVLIEHGDDPDHPIGSREARYPSRSEAVFRVLCDLARAHAAPEFMASVLLEPSFGISKSILEKAKPRAYAARQVKAALEAVSDRWPDVGRGGGPRPTLRNALVALQRLELTFEYDEFHRRKNIGGHQLQAYASDLSDDGCALLRHAVLERFGFDPGKDHIREAANTLCLMNSFNPVQDYLRGLEWDGVPRLRTWLHEYLNAPDTPLNAEIGVIVLVAAVRRVFSPGTKFDTILVLEGTQGSGKSTCIQILAGPENYSDQDILALDPKSQMEALEGVWLFEIGELEGISRADTSKVKAFASRAVDRARPAYGRFPESRPRHNVFIGTTNDDKYLRDPTGNRRFWPVRTGAVDLDGLRSDRDQLWAEAVVLERNGVSIVLREDLWDDARVEQEERVEDDAWLDILDAVSGERVGEFERVSTQELFARHLEIPKERQAQYLTKRVAALMRKLGWKGPMVLKLRNGTLARGYQRPVASSQGGDLATPTSEDERPF